MKKAFVFTLSIILFSSFVFAESENVVNHAAELKVQQSQSSSPSAGSNNDANFEIIPKSEINDGQIGAAVQEVGKSNGDKKGVWDKYNEKAKSLSLGSQFATGIMNWNTLLNYVVYLVRFIFQLGLLVGAAMLIYAGYLYGMSVYSGKGTSEGASAIKHAVNGVLIVLFSYAIVKILTSMFL